jgi:hypothetical protein
MIEIKVQCGCGQRYAFDVEPSVGTAVPAVACPVCGADGTAVAQTAYEERVALVAPVAAPARLAMSMHAENAVATVAPPPARRLPGQLEPEQAKHEARAKILWGDSPEDVIKYLMIQGFAHPEAASVVKELWRERAATIRASGIRHIVIGGALISVPIVTFFAFLHASIMPVKLLGLTVMAGLWGLWKVLNGLVKVVAPKADHGDAAD